MLILILKCKSIKLATTTLLNMGDSRSDFDNRMQSPSPDLMDSRFDHLRIPPPNSSKLIFSARNQPQHTLQLKGINY